MGITAVAMYQGSDYDPIEWKEKLEYETWNFENERHQHKYLLEKSCF